MTYKEILTLLSAGYSKAEIDALDAPEAPQAVAAPDHSSLHSEPQPSSQPGEAVPSSPADEPAAPDPQPAAPDPMEDMRKMFGEFLAGLQQANRENADMGGKIIDPHQSAINTLRSLSDIPLNDKEVTR